MMTPMILFRGTYSHAIEPDVHYIPLEKDFSNADAILSRLDDIDYLQGFADRAYERLVRSGKYGYRSFARQIEDTIEQEYARRIDPQWLSYRSRTAAQFASDSRHAEPALKTRLLGRMEKPTALPRYQEVR